LFDASRKRRILSAAIATILNYVSVLLYCFQMEKEETERRRVKVPQNTETKVHSINHCEL